MSIFSMRPTFETVLPHPPEEVFQAIARLVAEPPWNATTMVFDRYVEMHIPESEARYWSPHLSLTFEGDDAQTRIVGRLAPRQNVWTLVWIVYLAMAFSGFFALIFAYAHWVIGKSTWVIWLAPLSLLGIAMLYVVSHVGQSWSTDQMDKLRNDWQTVIATAYPNV